MGLADAALRAAANRPHVLVLPMPGGTPTRLAAEAALRHRGWPSAESPAGADIVLVAGSPGPELSEPLERLWSAVPAPRARIEISDPAGVAAGLDRAARQLADRGAQQAGAVTGMSGGADGMDGMDGMDGDAAGSAGDMGEMTMPTDQEMGEMTMPSGLSMAERAPDRDGLSLDQLHVAFGPLLTHWPAGLVVQTTLQGDVIQHAEITAMRGPTPEKSFWDRPWREAAAGNPVSTAAAAGRRAAAHLDSLGRFLTLAGWGHAAVTAGRLRDDVLAGAPAPPLTSALRKFARSVMRSRTLRWLTRGLGVLDAASLAALDQTRRPGQGPADVTDRYQQWCVQLLESAMLFDHAAPLDPIALGPPRGCWAGEQAASVAVLAALPRLLTGADLAGARLIIASLDPDLDQLPSRSSKGAGHGR